MKAEPIHISREEYVREFTKLYEEHKGSGDLFDRLLPLMLPENDCKITLEYQKGKPSDVMMCCREKLPPIESGPHFFDCTGVWD